MEMAWVWGKKSIDWRIGFIMSALGLACLLIGGWMLTAGDKSGDVITIVRGGIVFIAGMLAIAFFVFGTEWEWKERGFKF
jgi:hypothetical protein